MTISMTDTTLDMEKKAIKHYARRNRLRFWIAWIYCSIFLMSSVIFYIFCYTDMFNNYFVFPQLELRNGTRSFDMWERPPYKLKCNIYIFNYTNVDEFEAGVANKLRVQELGPYKYHEILNRTNVVLHDNGTITYQNKRAYEWVGGRYGNDTIVVPNVPLMFTTAYVRDSSFPVRLLVNTVLSTLSEETFINVDADGFIWGYDTQLFEMAKPIMMLRQNVVLDKFGMLAMKNGVDQDYITMHTGTQDIQNNGLIERVNGLDNKHVWDDEQCDKIGGTDGNRFSPNVIDDTSKPLYIYLKEFCRKMPFHFTEHVTTFGIPSLRYKFTPDAYNSSNKQNECFCPKVSDTRICPPAGLFNISTCNFGSPLLSSFPHFYGADKSLLEQIDGLNPRQEDHETYIDIHPRLALSMAGWSRLQVNLEVRKAIGVPFLGKLKDGTILPLMWIETGIDELPEILLNLLLKGYFTAGNVEIAVQWGSLITMILSLIGTIACLWKYRAE